jgi:archaemetzincin
VDASVLADLRIGLAGLFRVECRIRAERLDPSFAYHAERQQFHSSEILSRLQKGAKAGARRLGVTAVDLYIPILTFVFGEAEVGGSSAVVSFHRLRQEFYGLPFEPEIERQRLLKEAVHELGHTLELTHCADYRCAMAPSHSVEWIDVKTSEFCSDCSARVRRTVQSDVSAGL